MPKVIIHAGAHKTGTTLIQSYLSRYLRRDDFFYISPDILNKSNFLGLVQGLHNEYIDFLALARNAGWKSGQTIIVSHESLLGYSNLHLAGEKSYFYGTIGRNAQRLKQLLKGCDLQLIFYVRRQDDFFESLYLEHLAALNLQMAFHSFLKLQQPDRMSWLLRLNELTGVFGKEKLNFALFDEIKKGSQLFIANFLSRIGIDFPESEIIDLRELNSSATRPSLSKIGYQLAISGLRSASERKDKEALMKFLINTFSNSDYPRAELFSRPQRSEFLKQCEAENKLMFEKYFPDSDVKLWELG